VSRPGHFTQGYEPQAPLKDTKNGEVLCGMIITQINFKYVCILSSQQISNAALQESIKRNTADFALLPRG